jgi:hypothetical protein
MLAAFCVRLALGVIAPLLILPLKTMHPRFVRTQFLIALGLMVVAGLGAAASPWWVYTTIGVAFFLSLAGSVVWTLDPPPFGRVVIDGSILLLILLACRSVTPKSAEASAFLVPFDGISSSLLLGGALTAMLVGHSYLISPGLTMTPLNRMIALLAGALVARAGVAAVAAWMWSEANVQGAGSTNISLWLPVRWLVGILLPLGLTAMAWLTARIRSTQSATGILYVVVISAWLGELLGLLLLSSTGYPL